MNNLYEISEKEKDKYKEEFNKLHFAKELNYVRVTLLVLSIISYIFIVFLAIMFKGVNLAPMALIFIANIVAFIIYTIYYTKSFHRWMKIKHKIEF